MSDLGGQSISLVTKKMVPKFSNREDKGPIIPGKKAVWWEICGLSSPSTTVQCSKFPSIRIFLWLKDDGPVINPGRNKEVSCCLGR
jgi:hypothetical protein